MTERLITHARMYWVGQISTWVFPEDCLGKPQQTFWPTQYIHIISLTRLYTFQVRKARHSEVVLPKQLVSSIAQIRTQAV